MDEHISNINAAFMEVTLNKIEVQDKRIDAVEEKIKNNAGNAELIQQLIDTVEGLRSEVKNNRFPTQEVKELTGYVHTSISVYKELVKNKILHHHHVPKLIWITAGLFIVFNLVCAGWYSTFNKLDGYIANDTKYRQLRLVTAYKGLQTYLDIIDSIYNTRSDMRNIVLQKEEDNRKNFERLERAEHLKAEANELEKTVNKGKKAKALKYFHPDS